MSTPVEKVMFVATESVFDGKKIHGVLAIPRFSKNNRAYLPEELARGHGKIVPLYNEHGWLYGKSASDRRQIGQMILTWDPTKQQLLYDAVITDAAAALEVEKNKDRLGASLGVVYSNWDRLCGLKQCYEIPREVEFIEGSLTYDPSMPETAGTIVAVESVQHGPRCEHCRLNRYSDKPADSFSITLDARIATFAQDEKTGGLLVTGILAVPRMNLNGSCLMPEGLAKGHGLTIPMSVNHDISFDPSVPPVGSMTLWWNAEKMRLEYNGVVTDKQAIADVKSGKFKHTSISVEFGFADFDYVAGWFLIKNITRFVEGSLVEYPAIPEATVVAVETLNGKLVGLNDISAIKHALVAERLRIGQSGNFHTITMRAPAPAASTTNNSQYENQTTSSPEMSADPNAQSNDNKSKTAGAASQGGAAKEQVPAAAMSIPKEVVDQFTEATKLLADSNQKMALALESVAKLPEEQRKFAEQIMSLVPGARNAGDKPTATATNKGGAASVDPKERMKQIRNEALAMALNKTGSTDPMIVQQFINQKVATEASVDLTRIGNVAGGYWTTDMTSIPDKLTANLREVCDVKFLPKGAKTAHWTLMARPPFGALTPPTVPTDYAAETYKIEDVNADPSLRGVKQTITDQAVHGATTDLIAGIEMLMREAAEVDLDNLVITELDGVTAGDLCGELFGGNATSEATVDSADVFDIKLIPKAQQKLRSKGYAVGVGNTTLIIDPVQLYSLMVDAEVLKQFNYGVQPNSVTQVPMLFGTFIRTAPMKTGLGSPTTLTTYHAFLVLNKVAVGLAFSEELAIEVGRVVGELSTRVIASMDAVAKAKKPTTTGAKLAAVKIITA